MAKLTQKSYISSKGIQYFFYFLVCLVLTVGLFLPEPFNIVPVAIPIGVALVVLVLKKPFAGLLIYLTFFLIRPQEFVSVLMNMPVPLERLTAVLLFIALFLKFRLEDRLKLSFQPIDYGIIAFLAVAFMSVPFAIWIDRAWESWQLVLRLVIVYWFIRSLTETQRQLAILIAFVTLSTVFHAVASVVNYYRGITSYEMGIVRAIGLDTSYGAPNSLAATIVYTLPFMYYLYKKHRTRLMRVSLLIGTCIMLWCVILTGSRTGMAGVLFMALLIIWYNRNRLVNLLLLVLFSAFAWVLMPSAYQERFLSTTDLESDTSASASARGRIEGLEKGFELFINRPILGYGIGCYQAAAAMVLNRGWLQAHSLYGQLIAELGLFGILAFILWLYYLFKGLAQLSRESIADKELDRNTKFLVVSLKMQVFLLLFFGLAGHNLLRYNWYIISGLTVVMGLIVAQKNEDR
ncbi:MAG: O-antigen ligase family protein [Candidatus Zixiibacteriota bacterium]